MCHPELAKSISDGLLWMNKLHAALRMSIEISAGTTLVEAAKVGDLSEVTRLLARPDAKGFLNATDEDEESPLY